MPTPAHPDTAAPVFDDYYLAERVGEALSSALANAASKEAISEGAVLAGWSIKNTQFHAENAYNILKAARKSGLSQDDAVLAAYAKSAAGSKGPKFSDKLDSFAQMEFKNDAGETVTGKALLDGAARAIQEHGWAVKASQGNRTTR